MVIVAHLSQTILHRPLPDRFRSVLQVPAKQFKIAFDNNSSNYSRRSLLAIEERTH